MEARFDDMLIFFKKYLTGKFYLTDELAANINSFCEIKPKTSKQLQDLKVSNLRKLLGYVRIEDISSGNSSAELKSFNFSCNDNGKFQQDFINYCSYLEKNNEEVLLFFSDENQQDKNQSNNFYFVFDIYKDLDSSIGKLISVENPIINQNAIIKPTLQNPLPNSELCKDYKQVCKERTKGQSDKKSIYIAVCTEVAFRNGYESNDKITKINRSNDHIRHIFSSKGKKIVYLSADVENGGIEVCNEKGVWQGARSYTGDIITNEHDLQDPNKINKHSIKIKK